MRSDRGQIHTVMNEIASHMVKGAMEKVEAQWGRKEEKRGRRGESGRGLIAFEVRRSGKLASRFTECS